MTTDNNVTLKEQVRERYGAIAEQHLNPAVTAPIQLLDTRPQADTGCCGPAGFSHPTFQKIVQRAWQPP